METKHHLMIIIGVSAGISIFVMVAGCNMSHPEFDFNGNGAYSIPKQCEKLERTQTYQSCIDRKIAKENMCVDYFWWLRY